MADPTPPPKKIQVSADVIAGNKLGGMTPQYPAIKAAVAKPSKPKKLQRQRRPSEKNSLRSLASQLGWEFGGSAKPVLPTTKLFVIAFAEHL